MLKNFFKVAIRNGWRNKSFSTINITGLAIGMASALLIGLWIQNELSVDRFYTNKDRIYHMYSREMTNGRLTAWGRTPSPLAPELKKTYPEVEDAARFRTVYFLLIRDEARFNLEGAFADSGFLSILDFPLLEGNARTALNGPHNIVLTEHVAKTLFGAEDPMGKTVLLDSNNNFTVTGILKDLPANTEFTFQYLVPWSYVGQLGWEPPGTGWSITNSGAYVLLKPEASPTAFDNKVRHIIRRHVTIGEGTDREVFSQPITREHLYSRMENGQLIAGRLRTVQLFIIIAVFILLIACINFMNLATARSAKRAKEVGIRKTIGALRQGLMLQFIGEAILLTLAAFIAALVMVVLLLPVFNEVTGKLIALPVTSFRFWGVSIALLLATGLVAGSYPALYLSSLMPLKVLKGSLKFSASTLIFRKGLVVSQFVLSIVFIVATIVVTKQLRYVQDKNLGFDKENLLYVPMERTLAERYPLLKQQLASLPGITSVTYSNQVPTEIGSHVYDLSWEGKNPATKVVAMHNGVGYDYLQTLHLTLLMGRDFSRDFPTDSVGYIVNEAAWKMTGYKDPIGKSLIYFGHRGKIIGVVKDFHFQSLHDPIQPLVLEFMGERITWDGAYAVIKTGPGKTGQALAGVEKVCKTLDPAFPFRYAFADEEYQKLYNGERTVSKLSDSFAVLAIFISCLGLLGLAMFTAEQRRKEIGVRKVIGARVGNIVAMLSKDMIKMVVLSAIIATPIAWLVMERWLQNFAYRTSIDWWIFMLAGVVAVVIALATISYQAVKAARTNPVTSLRSE